MVSPSYLRKQVRYISACTTLMFSALLVPHFAGAAELGPDGEPVQKDSAESANRYLGNVYKDETAGIKMAPPAGSRIIVRAGASDLVTFVHDAKQWGGDLQAVILKKDTPIDQYLQMTVTELGKSFRGVQVLESRELQFGGRKAARLVTTMEGDITAPVAGKVAKGPKQFLALYRQQFIVQLQSNQFLVLTLYSALKDKAEATPTFNAMISAFEIFDKEQVVKRRILAIEAGKKWLAQRSAEELKNKLVPTDQLFRIKVAGKDIGYILFKELEVQESESRGIRIGVVSKTWLNDGREVLGQNVAYWAYSRDDKGTPRPAFSEWENATKTIAKVSKGNDVQGKPLPPTDYTFWVKEAGTLNEEGGSPIDEKTRQELIRERNELLRRKDLAPNQMPPPIKESTRQSHLIVTFMGDPTQDFHEANKGINVVIPDYRPAVLPKILEYSWPRVADLSKPAEMTFAVFNSNTRKMTLRTLAIIGPERVAISGKITDCIKCTDEMDNTGTTLWVDNNGRILKMLTSDQTLMEPTNPGTMKEVWGNKLGLFDQK